MGGWGMRTLAALWRREVAGPRRQAVARALRGALVLPTVLAFASQVLDNGPLALFAALGSFALLVMVDFTGPARARLRAFAAMAATGAVLIIVGTLCSRNPWLAASVTALVVFGVLFAGVINRYFAAARTGVILTFVLPVSLVGAMPSIPFRLAGWALAVAVGIPVAMLVLPDRPGFQLRTAAAQACRAIADLVAVMLDDAPGAREAGGSKDEAARLRVAADAVDRLRELFVGTPYRPTSVTGDDKAIACLVTELDRLLSLASEPRRLPSVQDRAVVEDVVSVLRASADRLDGGAAVPDLDRLERSRDAMAAAVLRRLDEQPDLPDDAALLATVGPSLRLRALSYATHSVAISALDATGGEVPENAEPVPTPPGELPSGGQAVGATLGVVAGYASLRSVWFRNSVRGAVGLALAVLVAHLAHVHNAFWVVLATLSVLRSNALGTSSTILREIAGTIVGVVAGGVLIVAIGPHHGVLWALLPFVVLLAGYAPGRLSFGAGQAAFSLMVLIVFNLIVPTGWEVGLVRIEDILIGCAISLVTGALLWPRGAGALLGRNLASAYALGIDYVTDAVDRCLRPEFRSRPAPHARAAVAAGRRLDDAFRHYVSDRRAPMSAVSAVGALVAGANRVRLAGHSLTKLAAASDGRAPGGASVLLPDSRALQSWYHTLAATVAGQAETPAPEARDPADHAHELWCLREAVSARGDVVERPTMRLLWAHQQLDELWDLEPKLAPPATELARSGVLRWRGVR